MSLVVGCWLLGIPSGFAVGAYDWLLVWPRKVRYAHAQPLRACSLSLRLGAARLATNNNPVVPACASTGKCR